MTSTDSATERVMCRGGCGYPLRSELARARGFGHRCWDKLPRTLQDAITAPAKPRRRRTRPAEPGPDQLPLASGACGRCDTPFDTTYTRFDGAARQGETEFCRRCVDRCHESTESAHACAVCSPAMRKDD